MGRASKHSFMKPNEAYQRAISRNKIKFNPRDLEDSSNFTINIRDFKKKFGRKNRHNKSMNCNVVNLFRSLQ